MSDSIALLRKNIETARELRSVVRTMKAVAAASISQYERSVASLADYHLAIARGLGLCLRRGAQPGGFAPVMPQVGPGRIGVVVFGSDQGLVGQFNELVAAHATLGLAAMSGSVRVWAVGERVQSLLLNTASRTPLLLAVPTSVDAIAPLVGRILQEIGPVGAGHPVDELHLFHNRPLAAATFEPVGTRLLPLDGIWIRRQTALPWPGVLRPDIISDDEVTLRALIREYLFISLFRACAESLASENASRLAAMQRADSNIGDVLTDLQGTLQRLRQNRIDEELFDVIAGYEALTSQNPGQRSRP